MEIELKLLTQVVFWLLRMSGSKTLPFGQT